MDSCSTVKSSGSYSMPLDRTTWLLHFVVALSYRRIVLKGGLVITLVGLVIYLGFCYVADGLQHMLPFGANIGYLLQSHIVVIEILWTRNINNNNK